MSVDRPVRPAPEAPVTRCTRPPVRRAPVAPARAPDRNAPPVARAAPPVRLRGSGLRGVALGGDGYPGAQGQGRDGQRDGAAARPRGAAGAGLGAVAGPAAAW